MHASKPILDDLQKLDPSHAREIKRVAGADTAGSSPPGANRVLSAVGMARKVLPSSRVSGSGINREPPSIEMKKTGKA
jgi:hypothetical protein